MDIDTLQLLAVNAASQVKQRGDKQWGAAWAYYDVACRMEPAKSRPIAQAIYDVVDEKLGKHCDVVTLPGSIVAGRYLNPEETAAWERDEAKRNQE